MIKRLFLFVAFVVIGFIVAFNVTNASSKDIAKFNKVVVDSFAKFETVFARLSERQESYANGNKIDIPKFRQDIESGADKLKDCIETLKHCEVPDQELCREFHQSMLACAVQFESVISAFREELLPYIIEHNPAAGQDGEISYGFLIEPLTESIRLLEDMQTKQRAMAKHYNLILR